MLLQGCQPFIDTPATFRCNPDHRPLPHSPPAIWEPRPDVIVFVHLGEALAAVGCPVNDRHGSAVNQPLDQRLGSVREGVCSSLVEADVIQTLADFFPSFCKALFYACAVVLKSWGTWVTAADGALPVALR